MRRFFARLANLFGSRAEREMAREIQSHLALIAEEFERRGMPSAEAQLAARREYGGVEQSRELHRETRTFLWVEQFIKDVGYSFRNLRRSPGFSLTAIAALALGMAAPTAIFSIVNAIVLKPLPFKNPDRLMVITNIDKDESGQEGISIASSPAMFARFRTLTDVFDYVAAFGDDGEVMNYTGGQTLEQWAGQKVTAHMFGVFGATFLLGRGFTEEEDVPNGPALVVLSEGTWKNRFSSDPTVVGRTISLNEKPFTIIGVMADDPADKEFGGPDTAVWVPFQLDRNSNDHGQLFAVMALLKPDVSIDQARARLKLLAAEFNQKYPSIFSTKSSFGLQTMHDFLIGDVEPLLWILLGAVSMVLLIACANVANLLLARSAGRRRELGIRAAIGAARSRIIHQLLTESILLALIAGVLGLWLGYGGIKALLATGVFDLPRAGDNGVAIEFDWRVASFAFAVSVLTGLLFGLLPALKSSRIELNSVLKDSQGRSATGFRQGKTRAFLVISEVGLAVVLLVGASLLIHSFAKLYLVDRGFDSKNVAIVRAVLTGPKFETPANVARTIRAGVIGLRAIPDVVAASSTCCIPLQDGLNLNFEILGRPVPEAKGDQVAGWVAASPGFFDVFRIPTLRGRTFTERDSAKGTQVVMINAAMAKRYWKDRDPIGEQIVVARGTLPQLASELPRQIIGIVGDVRDQGLEHAPRPIMYVPQEQFTTSFNGGVTAWVIRTRRDPHLTVPIIQTRMRQAIGLPISDVKMMNDVITLSTARQRLSVILMGIFGGAALLMAVIGIYGLMAYTVEQRTQEIGIRIALGADRATVRNMVLRDGMTMAGAGIVLGLVGAWLLSQFIESLLFGITSRDPATFIGVPAVLILTALLAVWLPARRALRIDPIEALRCE
jgi:predicted permease